MQLTGKLETFPIFFSEFSESALICEHFQKKMSLIAQVFLKLLTPKNVITYEHKRSYFWKLFGSKRVNVSLKLLKSGEKYFYPTFSSIWGNLR